jgi:hypothetical protein
MRRKFKTFSKGINALYGTRMALIADSNNIHNLGLNISVQI